MCLEITMQIAPDAEQRVSARRLSRETCLHVSKVRSDTGPALHFSATGGCSCGFRPSQYDAEASAWSLDPAHLDALAKAAGILSSDARRFSFLVRFLGAERVSTACAVSPRELAKIIRGNRIGNNVLYEVRSER